MSFGTCEELGIGALRARCFMVAGGRVGNILVVGDRTCSSGEGCSIRLSGFVRSSPASGAAGGETGHSLQNIERLASGVS